MKYSNYSAIFFFCIFLTSSVASAASNNGEKSIQIIIDSIKSVEQVKTVIRESLSEECGTGHCWNFHASQICDLTAALDVRVGYAITGAYVNAKRSIQISDADLRLMKLIFSQCKPSNYQYWNYSQLLHVIYDPSPKVAAQVNKLLGIKKN